MTQLTEEEVNHSDHDTADRDEETKINTLLFGFISTEMQIIFIASDHSFQSAGGTGCLHCYWFSRNSLMTRIFSVLQSVLWNEDKMPLTVALFVGQLFSLTIQSYILKYFIDNNQRSMK